MDTKKMRELRRKAIDGGMQLLDEHGVAMLNWDYSEGYRAGMRAAAEIVRTCAPPKSPGTNGPRWEIGGESRDAYAGAILAEADR